MPILVNPYTGSFGAGSGGGGGGSTGAEVGIEAPLGTWSTDGTGNEVGWRFTVGAADIRVTHLRFHNPDDDAETIRIYRWSDNVVMAEATVTGVGADDFGETQLGSTVDLVSGTDYILTQWTTPGRTVWFSPSTATVNSAVTYVQSYFGTSSQGKPTATSARDYWSPDMRFDIL